MKFRENILSDDIFAQQCLSMHFNMIFFTLFWGLYCWHLLMDRFDKSKNTVNTYNKK